MQKARLTAAPFSFGIAMRAVHLTVARPVTAAIVLLECVATSGWRIGVPDVSGNKFCSDTSAMYSVSAFSANR